MLAPRPQLLGLLLLLPPLLSAQTQPPPAVDGYHEFNYGNVKEGAADWIEVIQLQEPSPRAEIRGNVTVRFVAPGMNWATAWCWQQPDSPAENPPVAWGRDVELTPNGMKLAADGAGSFVFPADRFPQGPVTVRIHTRNDAGKKDLYELQLFNLGGVVWNQGIPKTDPAGAQGLQLVFQDDFKGPVSVTNDGRNARYMAHKPGGGDFSGWQFSDVLAEGKPFSQQGTWLRIAARKDAESPKGRSGILASVNQDFKGIWAHAPCYFECRFVAQSAPGTWPAFWTLCLDGQGGTDELDIIEAYGGRGKGNPNHPGYSLVSHFWGQKNSDGTEKKGYSTVPPMMQLGGKSYWSTTFHTYGVRVGLEKTTYYFDDIEVFTHPTNSVSRDHPHFFLLNLAIGGISRWPINLARYGEGSDMWVDYVRVYAKDKMPDDFRPNLDPPVDLATAGIGLNFSVAEKDSSIVEGAAGADGCRQRHWNNLAGANGRSEALKGSNGEAISGTKATWFSSSKESSVLGRGWGFTFSNLHLQMGMLLDTGGLDVTGVPFSNYDVYVYVGAGEHGGTGAVKMIPGSNNNSDTTYYYKIGWTDGRFVPSSAESVAAVKDSNYVVFRSNSAPNFKLEWAGNLKGAKTGVTAVQIVKRP